jgi:lysozyme
MNNKLFDRIILSIFFLTAIYASIKFIGWITSDDQPELENQISLVDTAKRFILENTLSAKSENNLFLDTLDSISYEDSLMTECIEHMKESESFSGSRYLDNDGSVTIGYGHHILKGEHFPNIITEASADALLRADFANYVKLANKYVDSYEKSLGLGMFLYNLGETKFKKSTLMRLIIKGKPIDKEIVKWCNYKYRGKSRRSRGLLKRRKFELSIYNLTK